MRQEAGVRSLYGESTGRTPEAVTQVSEHDVFRLLSPEVDPLPILVEVPHAGLAIPEALAGELSAPLDSRMRVADLYVDQLCAGVVAAGATLLVANCSRYVVDLNRAEDDLRILEPGGRPGRAALSTTKGGDKVWSLRNQGVVWLRDMEGRDLHRHRPNAATIQRRLAHYYLPYHRVLEETLRDMRARFGYALLIAAHSMPSQRALGLGPEMALADVVPGTRGRTSASGQWIDAVDHFFRARGCSLRHDYPYAGGWSVEKYGRPQEQMHAIQIELNRALYMDESDCRPLEGAFESLEHTLSDLIAHLAEV